MDLERPRARDMGIILGRMETGALNTITDVPGVKVGQVTLIEGEGELVPGQGPVRTGVTIIVPHDGNLFQEKVVGAVYTINGFGKYMGFEQVRELGTIESPIALTNTLNVGLVADALVAWALKQNPDMGVTTSTINPVVGECNDGYLNDIRGRHVRQEQVWLAIETASAGPVAEGVVGAGTGMTCYGFKGGVGTASRKHNGFILGVLVVSNFGRRPQLVIDGVPVGYELHHWPGPESPDKGSIMVVVATDAPLTARQLLRVAKRVTHGLARTGSVANSGSGDFVIAFSTAQRIPHRPEGVVRTMECLVEGEIDGLFQATVEATEEAVINSLFRAKTMLGRDGNVTHALPLERVAEIMHRYGRGEVHLP